MASVVTDGFRALVTDLTDGTASAPANYFIGSGTGAGTAAASDTALFTEVSESRVTATESQPIATTNRFVATQTYTGAKTITNAGLFTLVSGGTLCVKGDFTGIAVAASDSIQFTIDIVN
jgi:hypothetical protein